MKIKSLHFKNVGPLKKKSVDLTDLWTGDISKFVLFSGANGAGKSIVLYMIAMLWQAAGFWIEGQGITSNSRPPFSWLKRWEGCAIILDEIFKGSGRIGLIFGDAGWFEKVKALQSLHQESTQEVTMSTNWVGEIVSHTGSRIFLPPPSFLSPAIWTEYRYKMLPILKAKDWYHQGRLKTSLTLLYKQDSTLFNKIIEKLNRFLHDKEIETHIQTNKNELRVKLNDSQYHSIDALSAGEQQALTILYLLQRRLESDGIALIDDIDLHLHPSIMQEFLASVESLIRERGGQLLATSNIPSVWYRYDPIGYRVTL